MAATRDAEPAPQAGSPDVGPASDAELRRVLGFSLLLLTAIFVAGLALPPSVVTAGLYIVPVLVSLWASEPRVTLGVAAASTALAALGLSAQLAVSGTPDLVLAGVLNTAVAVFAVWATARLGLWRIEVERDLARSREATATTLESLAEGVVTADAEGHVAFLNQAAQRLTGWDADAARGLALEDVLRLVGPTGDAGPRGAGGASLPAELVTRSGTRRPVEQTTAVLRGSGGGRGSVTVFRDVTARRRYEEAMRALAYRDEVTGLPNRASLLDRLQLELAHARRDRSPLAVLFLDLDGFKDVNDTLGHAAGDRLLCEVGKRLTHCLRDGDTVARLGGDEFTVVLPGAGGPGGAARVADKIIANLRLPFSVAGHLVPVGASVGIALYPDDGADPEALLAAADGAMYAAKREGGAQSARAGESAAPKAPAHRPAGGGRGRLSPTRGGG